MHHSPDFEVIIVGSGFSGLGMAIQLKKSGQHSFLVLERASALGGTWRDNNYPGCACDVPSHLYSFSFEPNPNWSRMFATHTEIRRYLEHCADKYDVRSQIRFDSEVARAIFDETSKLWRVETKQGETWTTRHLVFGIGAFSRPAYPQFEGLETFLGKAFHSAEWDHDYDLRGKSVAVIGTGASSIQFVPQIAKQVSQLHLFQRTPPWILPKPDRAIPNAERWLMRALPLSQRLHRYWIYWLLESRSFGFTIHPRFMKLAELLGRSQIRKQIKNPELRKAVTPTYMPGCKRILMADDYYPALERPNVELVTDSISRVTERGIVTSDGRERAVDAIIYGTGFRVAEILTRIEVRGLAGRDINEVWKDGIEAYLGTVVSGFPNLYLLLGPNTGLGHTSMVFMIESQIRFVLSCMQTMQARTAGFVHVKSRAQRAFNAKLHPRLERSVWASGCQSWYLDRGGRIPTLWPGFTFEFWLRTRRINPSDFEFAK